MTAELSYSVVHICPDFHPYYSGRGKYLIDRVLPRLSNRNVDNLVISIRRSRSVPAEEVYSWGRVRRIFVKEGRMQRLLFAIACFLLFVRCGRQLKNIHFHGLWDFYGIFFVSKRIFNFNYIMHTTLLGTDDPSSLRRNYKLMTLRFFWLKKYDQYVAISTPIYKTFVSEGFVRSRVHLIYNGIESRVSDLDNSFLATFKEAEVKRAHSPICLYVGAVIYRKGIDVLLDAWTIIQKEYPRALLMLVGPYEFRDSEGCLDGSQNCYFLELKSYIENKKLNVIFKGPRENVEPFYMIADVFLFASRREGFGNVIAEALASGIPSIISQMDGISSDFTDSGSGALVARSTEDFLAHFKMIMSLSASQRSSMSKELKNFAKRRFDIDRTCDRYLSLYEGINY
jgi:glycosyltransferase involved in cell wall biosynthesis